MPIKIEKTYDPLTMGSYEHPDAPWVGEHPELSPAIARLERLMREYVERGVASCSVLIGGDRGAGKTSLVNKVVERLRRSTTAHVTGTPRHDYWTFPRPVLVRVHGPRCLDFDHPTDRAAWLLGGQELTREEKSKLVLHQVAESVHRALVDEYNVMFASLAENAESAEEREQSAQFRVEMDEGPVPERLREMWTLFSPDRHPHPKLPSKSRVAAAPRDQAWREMVAMASAIQLVREVRQHREQSRQDRQGRTNPESKADQSEDRRHRHTLSFFRQFAQQMLDGGHLLNPLAGLIVAGLAFIAALREDVQFAISLLLALLAGFTTTILLNFATARRQTTTLLSDEGLAAIDRTLPIVLRRMEHAGLFPVIIIDELDKADDEKGNLREKMEWLVRDLKSFCADHAFVCFLVGRGFYQWVLDSSVGVTTGRHPIDTFFTDQILVSHTPDSLSSYLDRLLILQVDQHSTEQVRVFLKHLYLYRAKGHLGDLQEAIAADHRENYTALVDESGPIVKVKPYQRQVFYQLAVSAVLNHPNTREALRRRPDLLQPMNDVLYGPARLWEAARHSFAPNRVCEDFGSGTAPEFFNEPMGRLIGLLTGDWKSILAASGDSLLRKEIFELMPELWPVTASKPALIAPDDPMEPYWYRWGYSFEGDPIDSPADAARESTFGEGEQAVCDDIQALEDYLRRGGSSLNDLCREKILLAQRPLLDFTFRRDSSWAAIQRLGNQKTRQTEIIVLHQALLRSATEIRAILLVDAIGGGGSQAVSLTSRIHLLANESVTFSRVEDYRSLLADSVNRILTDNKFTPEIKGCVDEIPNIHSRLFRKWCRILEFLADRTGATTVRPEPTQGSLQVPASSPKASPV